MKSAGRAVGSGVEVIPGLGQLDIYFDLQLATASLRRAKVKALGMQLENSGSAQATVSAAASLCLDRSRQAVF